jgi:DNA-binding MarR family transcriptional regulator
MTSSSPAATSAETRAELAARLRLAVTRTARRLRQQGGAELSPSLSAALATIARQGPLTPSELAAAERIQRPTATRLLARLEEEGLVTKTADPVDGRVRRVAVSPAGAALLAAARARKDAWMARALDALGEDDLAALERTAALLERLLEERA